MRRFILDTDIGADCDDAVAIAYLLGKQSEGRCTVAAHFPARVVYGWTRAAFSPSGRERGARAAIFPAAVTCRGPSRFSTNGYGPMAANKRFATHGPPHNAKTTAWQAVVFVSAHLPQQPGGVQTVPKGISGSESGFA